MTSMAEKGGAAFQGVKLLLCETPLPPVDEAIADELNRSNDAYPLTRSAQLRTCPEVLAAGIADRLRNRDILIKPLNDPTLGSGFMRITTALPEDNQRFVDALREVLSHA
jgi:hypothetical protein